MLPHLIVELPVALMLSVDGEADIGAGHGMFTAYNGFCGF